MNVCLTVSLSPDVIWDLPQPPSALRIRGVEDNWPTYVSVQIRVAVQPACLPTSVCVSDFTKKHKMKWLYQCPYVVISVIHTSFNLQRVWHPSTLLAKESYNKYSWSFACKMLDFAKQTEQIHATTNADMKVIHLMKSHSYAFVCVELNPYACVAASKPGGRQIHSNASDLLCRWLVFIISCHTVHLLYKLEPQWNTKGWFTNWTCGLL